jgi:hypothetical protein
VCEPPLQTAESGDQVLFSGSGGRPPYLWSAPGGSPPSAVGVTRFASRFINTSSTPRSFTATLTDQDGETDTCIVSVSCDPPSCPPPGGGCSYQGGDDCSCGTLVCPSAAPLICAPASQTVNVGQTANFQAGGGTSPYTWTAPGSATVSPSGSRASATYANAGSYTVQVRDAAGNSALCTVIVPSPTPIGVIPPPPTPTPPVTQVPTGPGESALLALIVAAIATLLYVGYASGETFRRREAQALANEGEDNIDRLDFRR